jgi:hypothetical protein
MAGVAVQTPERADPVFESAIEVELREFEPLTPSMRSMASWSLTVAGAGRALLEARGGRSGSLALLYSCAVLVSAAIDYPSLGYEQRDVRLRRLGRSLADAVTSADGNEHGVLVPLRLLCLIPFRGVRFTNRFMCSGHAHDSGGGIPDLSNLFMPPAWTRPLMPSAGETIPRLFRNPRSTASPGTQGAR